MSLSVLVTGASGNQGGAVTRALLERGHQVRALTRHPDGDGAQALRSLGAEIVTGDFEDAESLHKAAAGVGSAFAMGTPFEAGPETERRQSIALLDALDDSDAGHIVYSSVASALDGTGIPHFDSKAAAERHLETLATPHTVIAPTAFLENLDAPWVAPGLADGRYQFAVPAERTVQQVAIADLASFAVLTLEQPERFAGQRVELASVDVSGTEMAAVLSSALGRDVEYVEIPIDAIRDSGDTDMAKMMEFFRDGGYTVDIEQLRRHYPEVGWHTLEQWVGEHDWTPLRDGGAGPRG